jgi:hypothetical protein
MNDKADSTRGISDAAVADLLRVGVTPLDVLDDLDALAHLPPSELWADILERWRKLGIRWSDDAGARLLGETKQTITRWRRRKHLPPSVKTRLAALSTLLALVVCGKLGSANDHELRALAASLRELPDDANHDGAEAVLSELAAYLDKPHESPAI